MDNRVSPHLTILDICMEPSPTLRGKLGVLNGDCVADSAGLQQTAGSIYTHVCMMRTTLLHSAPGVRKIQ